MIRDTLLANGTGSADQLKKKKQWGKFELEHL